jgi:hypothetical protein
VAVRRRFHGTSSECGVGINPGSRPCDSSTCSVCSILTTGFQTSRAGSGPGASQMTLRYGAGIYSSSTSGKANDYAEGSEKSHGGKTMRTMFLVNAAAGRPFITTVGTIQGMTETPKDKNGHSYDSVWVRPARLLTMMSWLCTTIVLSFQHASLCTRCVSCSPSALRGDLIVVLRSCVACILTV